MSKRLLLVSIAVLVVVAIAPMAVADNLSVSDQGGRPLSTSLSGGEEVPPTDPSLTGTAALTLNPGREEVCFELTVNFEGALASHIHQAPAGQNGPIVVTLSPPPTSGSSTGCVSASRDTITAILRDPAGYYVNVHTLQFSGGAVRGQLGD